MTTETTTGAANQAIITFGNIALTIAIRRIAREAITASVEMHDAKMDFRTMADGTRGTIIIMMMTIEIAIETAIDMAIGVPEAETWNLAKAIAKRCPVQRHEVLIAPLGHPLSVFDQARDCISRGSRQSRSSSIGSRQSRSFSRRSSISSRFSHSSLSRSSGVDSGEA